MNISAFDIMTKHFNFRVFELFIIVFADLRMLDLMRFTIWSSIADGWATSRNAHFLQTLMIFIEKSCKVQHLPAVLTCEIVRKNLQFVEHDILNVIVIKDRIQHETICIILSSAYLPISLIEKSLTRGNCAKIHCLFCCAI